MLKARSPSFSIVPTAKGKHLTRDTKKQILRVLQGGVRAWLEAVLHAPAFANAPNTIADDFPIQTGAAKSTLVPIARYVNFALPVTPAQGRIDRRDEGERSATFDALEGGTDKNRGEYRIIWQTTLAHFLVNETTNVTDFPLRTSTPWGAISLGNKAFNKYVKLNLPDWFAKNYVFEKNYYMRRFGRAK